MAKSQNVTSANLQSEKTKEQHEVNAPATEFEVEDEETPSDEEAAVAIDEAEAEDHLDERDELSDEVEEDDPGTGDAVNR